MMEEAKSTEKQTPLKRMKLRRLLSPLSIPTLSRSRSRSGSMSGSSSGSGSSRRRDGLSMEINARQQSSEAVLHRIGLIAKYNMILTVDIENMVTTRSSRLDKFLPALAELLVMSEQAGCGDRNWKRFQFTDAVDLVDYNPKWQVRRDRMMSDWSDIFTDEQQPDQGYQGNLVPVLSWHVTVTIPTGTRLKEVLQFFTNLQSDTTISSISYGGALKGYFGAFLPKEVCHRFAGGVLQEDIEIMLECHHQDTAHATENFDSKAVLHSCIRSLSSLDILESNPCEYNVDHRDIYPDTKDTSDLRDVPGSIGW